MQRQEFQLVSPFSPAGDQPAAIEKLVHGLENGQSHQTLMGVTGSGKTFTMANVIERIKKPTLVISHNKTLAAQLYSEFKSFFPHNAVHYFVSYYDYYQPEAYIPQRDIYIEKDASINEEIDRLRLASTSSLVSRDDVIIVASVSSIYGLGSPDDYREMMVSVAKGMEIDRDKMLMKLVDIQYDRNDVDFSRSTFRVRGDCVEVWPSYEEYAFRIEFWGDEIDQLSIINPLTGETITRLDQLFVYPAKHFVMSEARVEQAIQAIRKELQGQLDHFKKEGKLLEAQRLNARTRYDLELMQEVGYCSGVENYSRHLAGRAEGEPPDTLYDFFPEDFLLFVDESHVSVSQVRAMWAGDRSRKTTLVDHGFRLPSALDNRPMRFEEWEQKGKHVVFVSATPGDYELEKTEGEVVEQIIRPTGLLDPEIDVVPATGQVPHLLEEVRKRAEIGERVLVTTLTKRMAEELSGYLVEQGVSARWLHSELDAFERVELLRELREGKFDVLVGVNLLREGLDLPEVSLVAVLDADKEGFLRSETSLIQTMGRAARHVNSRVILYADKMTNSMNKAITETVRRRGIQEAHNKEHNITPRSIQKSISHGIEGDASAHRAANAAVGRTDETVYITQELVNELEVEMMQSAEDLKFEHAAALRDRIMQLQEEIGKPLDEVEITSFDRKRRRRGKSGQSNVPRPKRSS